MEGGKNKAEWQQLASARLDDAEILLRSNKFGAAYYLAGYSIECALKARIAGFVRQGDFPPRPGYVRRNLCQHDLGILLVAAELEQEFDELSKEDLSLGNKWKTVKDWSEQSRYETRDQRTVEDMVESARGVIECIELYW
jgi:HEPN domain-containing protein